MSSQTKFIILFSISLIYQLAGGQRRIYEGDDLRYDVHSYLVKLNINKDTSLTQCSGSIISKNWIITAAHCVEDDFSEINVIHSAQEKLIAKVEGSDVRIHPDYCGTKHTISCDVALLYIREDLQFNDNFKSIELVTQQPDVGEIGTIAGYGETECGVVAPREAYVTIGQCDSEGYLLTSGTNIMCTVGVRQGGHGDSGGPLIYNKRLAGVLSSGIKLEKKCFTYYASVAENMNWIQSIVNGTL